MDEKTLTKIKVSGYGDMLAKVLDMELVNYEEVGSYQGEYFAVLRDKTDIVIYRGSYGSCSGCDWLESEGDWDTEEIEYLQALEYVKGMTVKARLSEAAFKELSDASKTSLLLESNDYYEDEIKNIKL